MNKKYWKYLVRPSVVLAIGALCLGFPINNNYSASFAYGAEISSIGTALVTSNEVNLRSGPGTNYPVKGQVNKDTQLTVLVKNGDWYKVQKSNGDIEWIASWLVKLTEAKNQPTVNQNTASKTATSTVASTSTVAVKTVVQKTAVVTATNVNLRSGPGSSNACKGTVSKGDRLPILDYKGYWLQVQKSDGQLAWIASWLVKVERVAVNAGNSSNGNNAWLPSTPKPSTNTNTNSNSNTNTNTNTTVVNNAPTITSLDVQKDEDKTTITVKSDQVIKYNSFTLSGPYRLVVDLAGTKIGVLPENKSVGTSTVSSIRCAQFGTNPLVARMVLDLTSSAHYRFSTANNGKTLIVEAYLLNNSPQTPQTPQSGGNKLIYIDPGHGGSDPGAPGYDKQLWECDVNLAISQKLANILQAKGYRVEMSRTNNSTVDLEARPAMANEAQADIFVCVHANANNSPTVGGTTTYFYAPASNPKLYSELGQRQKLAQDIQKATQQQTGLRDCGIRQANFCVLRDTTMPSILVETAFMSNPQEENMLKDANFQQKVASGIASGIDNYFLNP